jgi:K+-transporting ATPase, c chain
LVDRVKDDAAKLAAENPNTPIPADLVTTSARGLDPDITPAGALFQAPRVAKARGLPVDQVRQLVEQHISGRFTWHHRRAACERAAAQTRAGWAEGVNRYALPGSAGEVGAKAPGEGAP